MYHVSSDYNCFCSISNLVCVINPQENNVCQNPMRQPADIKRFAKIKVITLAHLFRSLCFAEYLSSVTMSSFMGISIYLYLVRYPYIYQKLQKYKIQKVAFTTRRLVMDDVSSDVKFYFHFILFLLPLGNCATNLLECLN